MKMINLSAQRWMTKSELITSNLTASACEIIYTVRCAVRSVPEPWLTVLISDFKSTRVSPSQNVAGNLPLNIRG